MARHDLDASDGGSTPPLSKWDRITGTISNFMLKPAPDGKVPEDDPSKAAEQNPTTIPEIEAAIKRANDKERLIGLLAARVAAAIALRSQPAWWLTTRRPLHQRSDRQAACQPVPLCRAVCGDHGSGSGDAGGGMVSQAPVCGNRHGALWALLLQPPLLGFWDSIHHGRGLDLVRAYRLSEKLKHAKAEAAGGSAGYGSASGLNPPSAIRLLQHLFGLRRSPNGARSSKPAEPLRGRRNRPHSGVPIQAHHRELGPERCHALPPFPPLPIFSLLKRDFASVHMLVTRM